MATKERLQNPNCGDTIKLRLFSYNSNNRANLTSIDNVNIYLLEASEITASNPDGRMLIQTINSEDVILESTGSYLVEVDAAEPLYTTGTYIDVWSVTVKDNECGATDITNKFNLYPDLWFTSPIPPVYDFSFGFRPNRLVMGSKRYLVIQITPNVPRGADLLSYYENLAIVSDLRVSIEKSCGDCVPQEKDLRLVIDRQLVDYREKMYAYYFIDTTQYDVGIYNVWFELQYAENTFVSEKNQLQIFE
ncbi:MAG: hypothetical protein WCJ72_03060 [Chryseobacterium sp.]